MLTFLDPLRDITFTNVFIRMLLVTALSGIIGLERSVKNRPAGFRTHILVGIGAATASMTGHYLYLVMQLPADPTRIGAQILTGLGFLGAGTIIVTKHLTITGLTTAAGLWTTGVIGISVGSGFYEGAVLATILVLFAETYLSGVGKRIRSAPIFRLKLVYSEKPALDEVMRTCKNHNLAITGLQVSSESEEDEDSIFCALLSLRSMSPMEEETLIGFLHPIRGIDQVEIMK